MKIVSIRLIVQAAALAIFLSLLVDFVLVNVKMASLALISIDLALLAPTIAPLAQSHHIFVLHVPMTSFFRTLPVFRLVHLVSSIFQAHATLALILAQLASILTISALAAPLPTFLSTTPAILNVLPTIIKMKASVSHAYRLALLVSLMLDVSLASQIL